MIVAHNAWLVFRMKSDKYEKKVTNMFDIVLIIEKVAGEVSSYEFIKKPSLRCYYVGFYCWC